jgi:hypothetical protein
MVLAVRRVSVLGALSSGKERLESYSGFRLVETLSGKRWIPKSGCLGVSGVIASPLPAEHLGVSCMFVYVFLHVGLKVRCLLVLSQAIRGFVMFQHSSVARGWNIRIIAETCQFLNTEAVLEFMSSQFEGPCVCHSVYLYLSCA